MKVAANKSLSTMSLIAVELSKAYLYRALRYKDSDSDSVYCLANVYLAVLYYATGQYQTAIDHCTLVMRSQDHSQRSSHVVQGELLPKIDDNIDNMLGLVVFYQHVRTAALNQQHQAQHVSVLTTELFADYLHINYLLFAVCPHSIQTSPTHELRRYIISIADSKQLFISDVLLFLALCRLSQQQLFHKAIWQQCPEPLINPTEHCASDMVELLQKSSIEHLTACRQIEVRDFSSVATIVTTDFESMYAYKSGDYQQCLQLSMQNVRALLYAADTTDVPVSHGFVQLLDDDFVSLTALTLIVHAKHTVGSIGYVFITQLTLSLYLMTQCQLKLRHSVTSLAQTLDYIKVAHSRHPVELTINQLTLKMIAHKALRYITNKNDE